MGTGIAQVFASNDFEVELVDIKERPDSEKLAALDKSIEKMKENLEFLSDKGEIDYDIHECISRINCNRNLEDSLSKAEWVFEALPENVKIKKEFLERADSHVNKKTIVCSTTSSISIKSLTEPLTNPERLLITHWLNPPFIIPLVEVAKNDTTSVGAVEDTVKLLKSIKKVPVVCRDSPGFIGARIQAAAMNEAVRIYEEGIAKPRDIDRAIKAGIGFRMAVLGLIEFIDIGGVDILYHVNNYLKEEIGSRFKNPKSVESKIDKNKLGLKTREGYYDFKNVNLEEMLKEKYTNFLNVLSAMPDLERKEN
ncbi:hypothetical protein AKJ38_02040 [candidate division MSBL1 archaeon SCGC-AAA259I14]|uniref:L-gulonate 3-dehydrogenase n=1 Tax=candidate division MSBL1 archaeon SCGC-AAA259I14 TaxID=1698268 RepID=A0A133US51_9EURY|nr:hypothetical protein AKJ38_02040 [candidate division MSBL1 archaeon SCGC-AAA259I14]